VLFSCGAAGPGGTNVTNWCNKDYDALVTEARQVTDPDKRSELYRKAQEIVHAEVPGVPIAHSITYLPMRKEVVGYRMSPLNRVSFEGIDIQE
jgi:dipeptide transport system substrate-binding protein